MDLKAWHPNVFVGLGSNIGDRSDYLNQALESIKKRNHIRVIQKSGIFETEPWGDPEQQPFLNQVVELEVGQDPHELLILLQHIENGLGRMRAGQWKPRTIDLDILLFGQSEIHENGLCVPHPELRNRRFVLVPLAEIAGDFYVSPFGMTVSALLEECPDTGWIRKYQSG